VTSEVPVDTEDADEDVCVVDLSLVFDAFDVAVAGWLVRARYQLFARVLFSPV
jgi:hypothetical protein